MRHRTVGRQGLEVSSIGLGAMRRLALLVALCLGYPGQHATAAPARLAGGRSGAWRLSMGGHFNDQAQGSAIDVAPDGSVAVIWGGGTIVGAGPVTVALYDPVGRLRWATLFRHSKCGAAPDFSPRVKFAPGGGVVAAGGFGVDGRICVASFDARGAIRWAVLLARVRGMPCLGIDPAGRIGVAGAAYGNPGDGLAVVESSGSVAWEMQLPYRIEHAVMTPSGELVSIGRAKRGDRYVDLDPATSAIDSGALVAIGRDGRRAWTKILRSASGHDESPLYLAVDGQGALYSGSRVDTAGIKQLRIAKLAADRSEAWVREIPTAGAAILRGGPNGIAIASERNEAWSLFVLTKDNVLGVPQTIEADPMQGPAARRELNVSDLGLGTSTLVASGRVAKRARVGAAGTVTTTCKQVARVDPDHPRRQVFDEACASGGWAASFAVPRHVRAPASRRLP
jgi:hypothetical protein